MEVDGHSGDRIPVGSEFLSEAAHRFPQDGKLLGLVVHR